MLGLLAVVGLLGAAAPAQAQYTTGTYYNPYTGTYHYSAGSYNPYVGGTIGYSSGYNAFTGGSYMNSGIQSPWVSSYQRSYSNPWYGAYGYSSGYRSPFGGYRSSFRRW